MKLHNGYMRIAIEVNSNQSREAIYGRSVKWTTYFKSSNDIEDTLKLLDIEKLKIAIDYSLISGYAYIGSFVKQIQSGKKLSDKQMIQCKRLASEIYKAKLLMDYIY